MNAYQRALSESLDRVIVVLEQPYLDMTTRQLMLEVKASLEAQIDTTEPTLLDRLRRFIRRQAA